ncbi:MAG: YfhO family protein, partial [Anaerolineae bacterium]|nr:YfhO family protein [Anaerolineae bacterium]
HYWLTSLCMLLFLVVLVDRIYPALLGSILWTYGGYLTGYPMLQPSIVETLTWLPLLLLGVHLSVLRPNWRVRGVLLSGTMIGLAFLAGPPQTATTMVYLATAYLIFTGWRNWLSLRGIVWRVALMGLLGAALAAVQLIPAYEMFQQSVRAEEFHYLEKSSGFAFTELVQIIWPRLFDATWWPLYPGVVVLILALLAITRPRREYTFWYGAVVIGALLSLGGGTVVYDVFYNLAPGYNIFRQQERAIWIVALALVIVATYELVALLDPDTPSDDTAERRLLWLARGHLAFTLTAYLVYVIIILVRDDGPDDVTANALGFVALISLLFNGWLYWRGNTRSALMSGALTLLIVVELFSLGMNSPNFVEDEPYNRLPEPDNLALLQVEVENIAFHIDGAAGIQGQGAYWRIPDIYGVVPFKLATIEKLRSIRVDRRWEVLAVRYATMIADVPDNVPAEVIGAGINPDGEEYTLYELTDPRPLAHLVYQVRVAEDKDDAHEIMKEPWIDLRAIGVVQDALPVDLPGERPADATVRAFKMVEPEYMEMEVSTSAPALLTLAVANYPGWRAEVNGASVDIVDTYAGLIGIPLEAGAGQKVTLQFMPTSVILGGIVSALALLALIVYVVSVALVNRAPRA